jgi:hypothetical protein
MNAPQPNLQYAEIAPAGDNLLFNPNVSNTMSVGKAVVR